jgi:hypothetical protein
VLNREQNFDVTTLVLHHDSFVGRIVEALPLNQHRIFEVMVLWLGGFAHHHAVKNFLAPCEPDGLEIAHLQILPSSFQSFSPP